MHNVEFFTDAQPAGLGTGLVGGGPREELPLDARLQPLVLQGPDMAGKPGVLPFARVFEVGLVVAESRLKGWGAHAHIPLLPLADRRDICLINHIVVFAPRTVHWTAVDPIYVIYLTNK